MSANHPNPFPKGKPPSVKSGLRDTFITIAATTSVIGVVFSVTANNSAAEAAQRSKEIAAQQAEDRKSRERTLKVTTEIMKALDPEHAAQIDRALNGK